MPPQGLFGAQMPGNAGFKVSFCAAGINVAPGREEKFTEPTSGNLNRTCDCDSELVSNEGRRHVVLLHVGSCAWRHLPLPPLTRLAACLLHLEVWIAPTLEAHASAAVGELRIVGDEEVDAVFAGWVVAGQFLMPYAATPMVAVSIVP